MKKLFVSTIILFYICCLSLQLGSVFSPTWVSMKDEEFSLVSCVSCKGLKKSSTFECLARETCENQEDSCSTYTDYFNAGRIFTFLQVFSMFFCVLILEKLTLLLYEGSYGSLKFLHIFSFCHLASQIAGLVSWFSLSSTSYEDTLLGPSLSLASIILSSLVLIAANWFVCHLKNTVEPPVLFENGFLCGINAKVHIIFSLSFGFFGLVLIYLGITSDHWVVWDDYKGGLAKCKNCLQVQSMDWDCVQGYYCEINEDSDECKTFGDLSRSSKVFWPLQTLSVLFIMLSFQQGTATLISSKYGWTYMSQIYISLALILNISATLSYALISGVRMTGECNGELCGEKGFVLIIISNLFIFSYLVLIILARPRLTNIKFFSVTTFDKTLNVTGRRESLFSDSMDRRDSKLSLGDPSKMLPELEMQDTSRRESSSDLLKYNTMNPDFIHSLPLPK